MKKTMVMRLMTVVVLLSTALHALAQKELYGVQSDGGQTWTYYYDTQKESRGGIASPGDGISISYDNSVVKVVFDSSMADYKPTSTTGWFSNCTALTTIVGLKYLNTENVFSMHSMFSGCSSLMTLDLSTFDTSNVQNMFCMFNGCTSLKSVNLSSFDTEQVTNMEGMFAFCSSLTSLDLSSFRTAQVTTMDGMFASCEKLKTIYADESRWSTAALTYTDNYMFDECMAPLTGGNGTNFWDTDYATDASYARIDKVGQPGYLTHKAGPAEPDPEPYAVLSNDNTVLTFYYDNQKAKRNGMGVGPFYPYKPSWYGQRNSITSVVFDDSFANCTSLTSTDYWFFELSKLSSITGIGNLKTDNVTNMENMFRNCSDLKSLDVTGFKTDNVTNMQCMFTGCSGLTSLDVTRFKTEKVTDMAGMFSHCSGLTSLDVSGFKTDNVANMIGMFEYCSRLKSLDLSGFNTNNVTSMNYMFGGCSSLTSLDLSGFNTEKVTDIYGMFSGCFGLTSLDLSGFKTDRVEYMYNMFYGCFGLTSLDLSGFKTDNVRSMSSMFEGCSGLTTIYVGDGWSTAKVNNGSYMFTDCTNLKGGAGTKYNANHVDYTYAHIDGGADNPGYFTQKDGPAMGSCDMSEVPTDNAFYAATSFLCERGILDGSKVDGKYLVEKELLRKHLANITFRGLFTLKDREIPSTFVSDQYPDIYDDLKSDASYYQAAKTLLYLDYGDDITPFDRDRDGFFPDNNESRINILKELMEAFNIKPDTEGTDNPFPNEADIVQLSETSPIRMGYVRQAAKLGIITTENEQFHPFKDCLRGEAFLMLARIIQKIEAGEITDPNPQESDFLDPNSGTGTAEPYAVYNNGTLTFYYDGKKSKRGGYDIKPFEYHDTQISAIWGGKHNSITTVTFDASFAKCTSITSTAYWFFECYNLTTINNINYLNTSNVTDMTYMFGYCKKLQNLDLSSWDTGNVKEMGSMFYRCTGLKNLDVSHFDTKNVERMSYLFSDCQSVTTLDVSHFNTEKVISMANMFQGCQSVTALDVSKFETGKVVNMSSMFEDCYNPSVINVSNFNTENVTDMNGMFLNCKNVAILDVSHFNTKKVTQMHRMFAGCQSVTALNVSGFDTSKATSMFSMFAGCSSLTELDVSGFITKNITNQYGLYSMFSSCSSLKTLNLKKFDTSNVKDMRYMFNSCNNLETIYCNGTWDAETNSTDMFLNCTKLTGYDDSKITAAYAKPIANGGYFTPIGDDSGTEPYAVYNNGTLTFYYDGNKESRGGYSVGPFENDQDHWGGHEKDIIKVVFDSSFADCYTITSTSRWFRGFTKLESIEGIANLNTTNVTDMSWMFADCRALKSVNLSSFKTGSLVDMSYMFYCCFSLKSLDFSHFKTDNMTGMYSVFYGCSSLKSIDLSNFNTSQVENMGGMFNGCNSLTSVNLSNFNTDKVTNICNFFTSCQSLTSLDLSSFNTANVTNMYGLFDCCSNLKTIYVGDKWSTAAVTKSDYMFNGCTSLIGGAGTTYDSEQTDHTYARIDGGNAPGYFTSVNDMPANEPYAVYDNGTLTFYYDDNKESRGGLSVGPFGAYDTRWGGNANAITQVVFDPSFASCHNITSTARWFDDCGKLISISGLEYLNTENVTDMQYMFFDCYNLTSLNLKNFNTSKVTNMSHMFCNIQKIKNLDVTMFDTSNVTDMSNMFTTTVGLTSLDLSHFNTEKVTTMSGMFQASNVTSLDLSSFNTDKVTTMSYMFNYCSGLTSLDISTFNTEKVTSVNYMFHYCTNLTTIIVCDSWTTEAVVYGSNVFVGCKKLIGGAGTTYDSDHTDYTYARIDGGTDAPGYLTSINDMPKVCAKPVISVVDGRFVFDCSTKGVTYKATISKPVTGSSITLNDTYTVSVYATKDGYEDSDVVTAEVQLGIPGENDDVDGDGKVTIIDAETIVNIILNEDKK